MIQLWVSGVVSVVALAKSESGGFEYVLDTEYSSGGCQNRRDTTGWITGRVVGTTHLVLCNQVSRMNPCPNFEGSSKK